MMQRIHDPAQIHAFVDGQNESTEFRRNATAVDAQLMDSDETRAAQNGCRGQEVTPAPPAGD
jgi:hypothetical protein